MSHSFEPGLETANLSIGEAGPIRLTPAMGLFQFRFIQNIYDEKTNTFRFLIEGREDSPGMGGDGPRKGICRINENGGLEIIETRSAAFDFPLDFSEASKAKAIYWKLTRKPASEE